MGTFSFGFSQNLYYAFLQQQFCDFQKYNSENRFDFNTNFQFFYPMSFQFFIPRLPVNKITYDQYNNSFASKVDRKEKNISYDAKVLKETWSNKKPSLTNEFYNKVVEISKHIKCDPNVLMGVMNSESGIKHTAVNKESNATGLIQFMPSTAKGLGTSVEKLKAMSAVEQLDYVEKYLQMQKKAAGFSKDEQLSLGDLYALVFLPARAGRSILTTKGESYYSWNKALDRNNDGKIAKSELDDRVRTQFMA